MLKAILYIFLSLSLILNTCLANENAKKSGISMTNQYSEPYVGYKYVIEYNDEEFEGVTDSDGIIPLKGMDGEKVMIRFYGEGINDHENYSKIQVLVGGLKSLETVEGLQQRLNNFYYYHGKITGEMDENTIKALKKFQHDNNLKVTGMLDPETKKIIAEKEKR
ncbi:peptidoglycan-binding protein [Photobacterium japonica]|uniref:peptidoglycan-binding domain-containing protein n=1 Tax=Photobacterium japonica TaxID=2910235 RepID=UPI003D14611F